MPFTPKSFERARTCFEAYVAHLGGNLPRELTHLVQEARDLLQQLDALVNRIEERNEFLTSQLGALFPSPTEAIALLRRSAENDPELAEWFEKNPSPVVRDVAAGSGRVRGSVPDERDPEVIETETDLYQDTLTFYRHAHRICKILRQLPHLSSFDSREIAIVRNQLIEHPGDQRPTATLPSFGWGTAGPRLKPIRSGTDSREHNDEGLFHNASAFQEALEDALCIDS